MKSETFSYTTDTQIIRIPTDVKETLDRAKPGGIELWKFSADVILIGLAVLEKMRGVKELDNIMQYKISDLLLEPIEELITKKSKK